MAHELGHAAIVLHILQREIGVPQLDSDPSRLGPEIAQHRLQIPVHIPAGGIAQQVIEPPVQVGVRLHEGL